MRRFEVHDPAGRLIVPPPRANTLLNVGALLASLSLAPPGLVWALSLIDDGISTRSRMILLLIALAASTAAAAALLVLLRAYRRSHPGKLLILDRRRDTVTLGDERLCALSELACVELRLRPGGDDEIPQFEVGLVVAGLRPPAAPRAAPSAFEDAITVGESPDKGAMRAYAARIAAFAGVPVEERGW
jgi:hypothetical protein